jgi:hypothetical protein
MSLPVNLLKSFGTYCIADTISNFIQHPTQKMDYGALNKVIGREVNQNFWGTRTQHIFGVAAVLTVADHASQAIFSRYLGRALCFAKSPATFVAHTVIFIFSGVTVYVGIDSAVNPLIEDKKRGEVFVSETYASAVGSCTAWFEPYVAPTVARFVGPAAGASWFGSALLPATLAYTTVKGVGWNDWGDSGLTDFEKKLTYPDKK